jgi:hypothetical protein
MHKLHGKHADAYFNRGAAKLKTNDYAWANSDFDELTWWV